MSPASQRPDLRRAEHAVVEAWVDFAQEYGIISEDTAQTIMHAEETAAGVRSAAGPCVSAGSASGAGTCPCSWCGTATPTAWTPMRDQPGDVSTKRGRAYRSAPCYLDQTDGVRPRPYAQLSQETQRNSSGNRTRWTGCHRQLVSRGFFLRFNARDRNLALDGL
jgi:hypothetical protein